jgi:hypothetical protein
LGPPMQVRFQFTIRRLMIAVAAIALVLESTELVRRRFLPPPPSEPDGPWLAGQRQYYSDKQGDVWCIRQYHDLDEGMKGINPPRCLTLQYRVRRWGPLTWTDSIKHTIQRAKPP